MRLNVGQGTLDEHRKLWNQVEIRIELLLLLGQHFVDVLNMSAPEPLENQKPDQSSALVTSGSVRPVSADPDMRSSAIGQRILLVRLGGFGDVIFTLPAIHLLRTAFPNARITFLVYKEFASLLEGFTGVDAVLTLDR